LAFGRFPPGLLAPGRLPPGLLAPGRLPPGLLTPPLDARAVNSRSAPAVPSDRTTPAHAAAPAIAAPVPAGTAPSGVVPAVPSAAEDELNLLQPFMLRRDRDWLTSRASPTRDRASPSRASSSQLVNAADGECFVICGSDLGRLQKYQAIPFRFRRGTAR
jgi:hypothetical protein